MLYTQLLPSAILLVLLQARPFEARQVLDCWRIGINYPCICKGIANEVDIICDNVVFSEFPHLLQRLKIRTFSQSNAELHTLDTAMFARTDVTIQNVDFSQNKLFSVTRNAFAGIEASLEKLNLSHNSIGDVFESKVLISEFQDLKNLKVLDLSYNHLKDFAPETFSEQGMLKELYLEGNELSIVPKAFGSLTSLEILNLKNNRLQTITSNDFKFLINLKEIIFDNNFIQNISAAAFQNMPLEKLSLHYNLIDQLPNNIFNKVSQTLQFLDISYNTLMEFPYKPLNNATSLQDLHLQGNLIGDLNKNDFSGLNNLNRLDLSRNRVTVLESNIFKDIGTLKELYLGVNPIKKIEDDALTGLDQMETLSMRDLGLNDVPMVILQPLSHIKDLDLSHNKIMKISASSFQGVTTIETLNLENNLISTIPDAAFKILLSLKNINIRGNRIRNITPEAWTGVSNHLEQLDISKNKFSTLPQLNMPSLTHFRASENNIGALFPNSFNDLMKLKVLDLSFNHLTAIQLSSITAMDQLQSLQIHHNEILSFEYKLSNPSLEVFNASYNKITIIHSMMFRDLSNLSHIDLSNNVIEVIDPKSFENLPNLLSLNLQNNKLKFFPSSGLVGVPNLIELNLGVNNINNLSADDFQNRFPRLAMLKLSQNELTSLQERTFQGLSFLAYLDLSDNLLDFIPPNSFSDLSRLYSLLLDSNKITNISETAFQNSRQLHKLDLHNNKLTTLPDHIFSSLIELDLNLRQNMIAILPNDIFRRFNLDRLQKLDLSYNKIELFPFQPLRSQDFNLIELDLSHNSIRDIPTGSLINIHTLDLSDNPLSQKALSTLLNIPRLVRNLNLASTGLNILPQLETPFIKILNLSRNSIGNLQPQQFEKAKTLEVLDLSYNQLTSISQSMASIWPKLGDLKSINLSNNPIVKIENNDFHSLEQLNTLVLKNLPLLSEFDETALTNLPFLQNIYIGPYPKLSKLNPENILSDLPPMQEIEIEIKQEILDKQLRKQFGPKLNKIALIGDILQEISNDAFSGLNSQKLEFKLINLTMQTLNATPFYTLPRSTNPNIDFTNSNISPHIIISLIRQLRASGRDVVVSLQSKFCSCSLKDFWKLLKELTKSYPKQEGSTTDGIRCTDSVSHLPVSISELSEEFEKCTNGSEDINISILPKHITTTTTAFITSTARNTMSNETILSTPIKKLEGFLLKEEEEDFYNTTNPPKPKENVLAINDSTKFFQPEIVLTTLSTLQQTTPDLNTFLAANFQSRENIDDIDKPVPIILMSTINQNFKPITIPPLPSPSDLDANPTKMNDSTFITVLPLDVSAKNKTNISINGKTNTSNNDFITVPSLGDTTQTSQHTLLKASPLDAPPEENKPVFLTISPLDAIKENPASFIIVPPLDSNTNDHTITTLPLLSDHHDEFRNNPIIVPSLTSDNNSGSKNNPTITPSLPSDQNPGSKIPISIPSLSPDNNSGSGNNPIIVPSLPSDNNSGSRNNPTITPSLSSDQNPGSKIPISITSLSSDNNSGSMNNPIIVSSLPSDNNSVSRNSPTIVPALSNHDSGSKTNPIIVPSLPSVNNFGSINNPIIVPPLSSDHESGNVDIQRFQAAQNQPVQSQEHKIADINLQGFQLEKDIPKARIRINISDNSEHQIENPKEETFGQLSLFGTPRATDNGLEVTVNNNELEFESITGNPKVNFEFIDDNIDFYGPSTPSSQHSLGRSSNDHMNSAQITSPSMKDNLKIGIILGSVFGGIALIIIIAVIICVAFRRKRSNKMYPNIKISGPIPRLCTCHNRPHSCPLHRESNEYGTSD